VKPDKIDAYVVSIVYPQHGRCRGCPSKEGRSVKRISEWCFSRMSFSPLVFLLSTKRLTNKSNPVPNPTSRLPIHTIRAISNSRLRTPTPSYLAQCSGACHFGNPDLTCVRLIQSCKYVAATKLGQQIASTAGGAPGMREKNLGRCVGGEAACGACLGLEGAGADWYGNCRNPQHQIQPCRSSRLSATASAVSYSTELEVKMYHQSPEM
jgi:hypothetical protein